MGLITGIYRKNFLKRYDKDEAIPYYSAKDFPDITCEENTFLNSENIQIRYFYYYYDNYKKDKLILFCPGMGPGHTAYLAEIVTLCKEGYRVLTLDYTGCGASGGEYMTSVNAPCRDAMELLKLTDPTEETIVIGHSLGGYTALSVANMSPSVKKAVIISGFVGISDEMMGIARFRPLADVIKRYERKLLPDYGKLDNREYLKKTDDRLLWIHSKDDPVVNYRYNACQVLEIGNPSVRLITVDNRKHNPNYSPESLKTMSSWIGEYNRLIKEKKLTTLEERKAFFSDKPISKMTAQDPEIFGEILDFIGDLEK